MKHDISHLVYEISPSQYGRNLVMTSEHTLIFTLWTTAAKFYPTICFQKGSFTFFQCTKHTDLLQVMEVKYIFFFCGATAQIRFRQPILGVSRSRTHAHTHTHKIGLLLMSDQMVSEAITKHNKPTRRTPIPSAGFKPMIPTIQRPQTARPQGSTKYFLSSSNDV